MRMKIAVLGLVLALAAPAAAQTGKPYVKFPQTKESLARAIEQGQDGDMTVLNISATDFVKEMNEIYHLKLENREDLANHIRSMYVVSLPQDREIHFGRLIDSKPDSKGWNRRAHPNEQGLKNDETQRIELSLWCANPTPGLMFVPLVVIAKVVVEKPAPPPTPVGPTVVAAQVGVTTPQKVVVEIDIKKETTSVTIEKSYMGRNWGWYTGGTIILGAAGYFICKNNCRSGNITNNNMNMNTNR